jgi:hypothetical protein
MPGPGPAPAPTGRPGAPAAPGQQPPPRANPFGTNDDLFE